MTDAVIGIIDDYKLARTDLKDMADDLQSADENPSVQVPETFSDTERLFLFNIIDGLLIDVNLRMWDLSKRLIRRVKGVGPIHDGIDIANLAFKLFKRAKDAIYIYSSEVDLNEPKYVRKLDRLPFIPNVPFSKLNDYQVIKQKYFRPLFDQAIKVRSANPLFQLPDFAKMAPSHRVHAFKSIYFSSANWLDCHFDAVGDYAWVVICGHKVELDSYGDLLHGGRSRGFRIKTLKKYFDLKNLKAIGKRRKYFPFILWNARKPEFIEQQFQQAGPRLINIPDPWRSFFGVAMARPCAQAFIEGGDRRVLGWCQQLDEVGKVEVTKVIHKMLVYNNSNQLSDFRRITKQLELPQIIDILEGKVEEINEKESKAIVTMRSSKGGSPFSESFDLKMLQHANIRFLAQRFDYTVYRQPLGDIAVNVEPIYDEGKDT